MGTVKDSSCSSRSSIPIYNITIMYTAIILLLVGAAMGDFSHESVEVLRDERVAPHDNGFQPESSLLPVAPAFPHPIPKFVMDQIHFAEQQRAARAQQNDSDEE